MSNNRTKLFLFAIIIFTSSLFYVSYAQSAEVSGKITDATDGSPLWGSNVILKGTSNGTTTGMDGKYRLMNIQEGNSVLVFRYLGYVSDTVKINITAGQKRKIDIKLKPIAVNVNEVVITAQRQGQQEAINQQLNSNTIVNIVSRDKIMELPDQNAAETLARLPGISLQRDGGEGQKVVIRGLAPKFTNITVNGQKIQSTDPNDRSVDLSSISPDMLAGIEVFKSVTSDMDADAVGGTVNFIVKQAADKFTGDFKIQNGYSSQQKYYGNYRSSVNLSNRFLNNTLGLVVTANIQKADRSSDALTANYPFDHTITGTNIDVLRVGNLNLIDDQQVRTRYGASLSTDYDFDNGNLVATGFWSQTDRNDLRRRKRYQIDNARTQYEIRQGKSTTQLFSGNIMGNYILSIFQIDGQLAFSQSDQNTPEEYNNIFQELSSLKPTIIINQGPKLIPLGVKDDLNNTTFKESDINSYKVLDFNKTAQLNVKVNFDLGNDLAGYLKFGGKFRAVHRNRDNEQYWTSSFNINSVGVDQYKNLNTFYEKFALTPTNNLLMSNFLSPNDLVGKFLNGEYAFGPSLDPGALTAFTQKMRNVILSNGSPLYVYNPATAFQNYQASENVSAAYAMADISLTPNLTVIPGVRFENTYSDFKSIIGTPSTNEDIPDFQGAKDTVGSRTYYDILPNLQVKYKLTGWMDIRGAVTRTLSRPDYFNLVPWQQIDVQSQTINKGNPILKHTRVWNYDLYLSIYNEYGLFTVGSFYKKLWDIDYLRSSIVQGGVYNGYAITQPVNADLPSTVYGVEIDLQSNLALLPSPFDGFVFYANLSYMKSETSFPLLKVSYETLTVPPYILTIITNTERTARMPGQSDYIGNLAIGYEKGGFSGRVSVIFQGKSLAVVDKSPEYDVYTQSSVRWDITMQQKIFKNISIYMNVNNLTNIPDLGYQYDTSYPTNIQYYGWTADLGVKIKL